MQRSLFPFSTIMPPHFGHFSLEGFCQDMKSQSGLFPDLGDVLLLQGEVFAQGVPRYGILPDVVERPQHLPSVLQRVVVVGEDGSRRPRQLADVADRLGAQQQDHGEKNADAQGDSPLYSHGL